MYVALLIFLIHSIYSWYALFIISVQTRDGTLLQSGGLNSYKIWLKKQNKSCTVNSDWKTIQ